MIDPATDHLVYVVPDLGLAVCEMEARLGVPFTPGGSHPGLGTRNALLRIGPQIYLELLGPDPEQPRPSSGLWLGAEGAVRHSLATWCARSDDLAGLAEGPGQDLVGPVKAMSRTTPAGARLAWTLTMPVAPPPHGGIVPFFIDWGDTAHPCTGLHDYGVRLRALRGRHPTVETVQSHLSALGIALDVQPGRAALEAYLEVPGGGIVAL